MMPLHEHRILALGGMAVRPLAQLLQSLGAVIVEGQPDDSLEGFSFVIDDQGLELLQDQGWDAARVAEEHPDLIHASVSTFGSGNERSRWHGSELVASAMGGTLRLTGNPERRPVKEALDACTFHADMVAAAGLMAAHYARGSSGLGQHVDVSIQEVAFNRNVSGVLGWQFDRRKLHRAGPALNYGKAQVRCIWPLSDGWCFHSLMTGKFGAPANQGLSDWMDEAGADNPLQGVDWQTYNRSTLDPAVRTQWEQAIEAFFRTRSKHEIATEGRRRGINACVAAEPADVLADPHLAARGFWQTMQQQKQPGRFVRIEPGADGEHLRQPEESGPEPGRGPLSGLRVLDFSWALVGSITTKTLGDLGAEIIKVESRSRPCLSRLDVQVSASQAGNFDDKPWFAHLNTSKRSLALDMKHPRAFEVLEPLIDWAVEPADQVEVAARIVGGEDARGDGVERLAQFGRFLDDAARVVAVLAALRDLLGGQAEDHDVLLADLFADLDIGAVERADGQRAVERELHVAGTRGLETRRGDLLGEIGGRGHLRADFVLVVATMMASNLLCQVKSVYW